MSARVASLDLQSRVSRILQFVRQNALPLSLAVLFATLLKRFYSEASPEQLTWLTAPIGWLVTLFTGIGFDFESGVGYVNPGQGVAIVKACTGINFLLALFCMLTFGFLPSIRGQSQKILSLAALALGSFLVTVLVNAVRITLSIQLYASGMSWGWLTPGRLHRAIGILIYFAALCAAFLAARWMFRTAERARSPQAGRPEALRRRIPWAPLAWYLGIAIVVPLLGGALHAGPEKFLEHCAWVVGLSLAATGLVALACRAFRKRQAGTP